MTVRFEEKEWNLIEMFRRESRLETIGEIHNILLFTGADEALFSLINSTLEKLWFISDKEFIRMGAAGKSQQGTNGFISDKEFIRMNVEQYKKESKEDG